MRCVADFGASVKCEQANPAAGIGETIPNEINVRSRQRFVGMANEANMMPNSIIHHTNGAL